MDKVTNINPESLKKTIEEAGMTIEMLTKWAQTQGESVLKQMELRRMKTTLQLGWPRIKTAWLGGFVSGVNTGFQLGYQAANKLSAGFLNRSSAAFAGTEKQAIEESNARLKNLLGEAIGEASMCWLEIPKGIFDSAKAQKIADRLYTEFATPIPESPQAAAEAAGQERFPLV